MRGDAQALWLVALHRLHHRVTEAPKRVGQSPDLCTAIAIRLLWYRAVVDHGIC